MESIKQQVVRFNSSQTAAEAKNSSDKGTIYFTIDERLILNKTDFTGVKAVSEGATNGTVNVDGTDVAVHGLGSAAYTSADAYASAEQGTKADNAVQTIKIGEVAQTKTNGVVNLPAYPTTLPASDVSDWAKAANKPVYTAAEVSAIASTEKGVASGVATLDENGLIPSSQLPSYVDDVIEAANFAALDEEGESGKIYVTLDDNKTYRWSGTTYIEISNSSIVIGTVTGTALDGKVGTDHITDTTVHITSTERTSWDNKQDAITDLADIRANAINGAVAYNWGNHADAGYMPAADLADWAKANTKPTYNATEVALNNYTIATTAAAVGATDTVQVAIGKLEKQIAGKTSTLGTVTSVDLSVPTGLAVTGNPVTTSGTLAIAYASGYAIPTTAKQSEWDGKQDAIGDLDDIREGAEAGALAAAALIWD